MAYAKALVDILTHDRHVRGEMDGAKRVYAIGERPQNAPRPYVTYQPAGEAGNTHHQQGTGGLRADDVLVRCWADDFSGAEILRGYVSTALVGSSGTFDGETLQGIFESDRDVDAILGADRSEHQHAAASMVLKIWHED